jgi:hypothetical protein
LSADEKLVEVYRAMGEMEARVIQGLLESYGVPCILESNAARSVHAFAVDGMGEVRIKVSASMAERAKELIREEEDV